ncbi:putative GMC-type oxidoreductase Rv1279/MT1316 OS=Mycobacterium tuberculosis GN=Rv1279 PE=3 SV=1 [Rhizoctonia solani AG-1 IB]|uniref:Putative GMC-type oxidoreductase Rv1279/MT1316 n=1 Tax=Thanatephorus cucumeris (strain AG1-IB / isolate 7/3/14) TaxID=1108050 RepID=A0A0B7F1N6_THACB|nr:putative GMC-type oxidoreductase Rv1279/MT1316 OS=Mycobacterium tuberculosis GN=Rv1279 PE=3 SV=1 [Rhizoctonia solani AG-1 IB]
MLYTDPTAFISRTYDYVIIGGGVVGLVIAARLSEDPDVHVAVLEAGGYSTGDTRVTVPAYFWKTHGDPEFDWLLKTAPQSSVNGRRIPLPRGKTLGGTSVINTMTWFRGVREDYDALVELGNPGWGWDDWVPYFCKSETVHPPPDEEWARKNAATVEPGLSGTSGPVQRSFAQWLGDTHIPFLESFEKIGIKPNPEANTGHNIGTFTVTTTVDPRTSQRSCSTTAYFEPNASRRNLHVLTGATVNRVLIHPSGTNGQHRATGVEFIHLRRPYRVEAVKEVIICAGAYLSPAILERSGIGCSRRLRSLGIPDFVDLPGVGENLQDHIIVPSSFELKDKNTITGDLLRDPEFITQELERYRCEGGGVLASIHSAFSMVPLQNFTQDHLIGKLDNMLQQLENDAKNTGQKKLLNIQRRWLKDPKRGQLEVMHVPEFCTFGAGRPTENGRYVSFLSVLMQPTSRGNVHVSSSDPLRAPIIDPRYYHDRFDLEMMMAGLKYTQKLANTEPLASFIQKAVDPRPDQMGEVELEEYARSLLESGHHPVGTNSMMPRAHGGVVDSKLKVYGVDNLRVADGSIFPLSMSCHPQATLYALGEKASDMIKKDFYGIPKL